MLASRLKEKNLQERGTSITFYRTSEQYLLPFFTQEKTLFYCNDVGGLLRQMGVPVYIPTDWRLFIDSSKRSLKCVLLHNGNEYASIPIGHSTVMKEQYESIKEVLHTLSYNQHNWVICVDLKMLNFLLGQQSGFTKYPCFLCLWDSRAKTEHWVRRIWPPRSEMKVGQHNS